MSAGVDAGHGRAALPWRARGHWLLAAGPPDRLRRVAGSGHPEHRWWSRGGDVLLMATDDLSASLPPPGGRDATDGRSTSAVRPVGTDAPAAVAVRGQLRCVGRRWTPPDEWADAVLAGRRNGPYGDPLEGTTGDGAAAVVDPDGRGAAAADPTGLAALFRGGAGGVEVVATRPGLVADALAGLGAPCARDPLAGAWLALSSTVVAEATGYVGVERVPTGSLVVVRPGGLTVRRRRPWRDPTDLGHLSADEMVDVAEAAIVDDLRSAADLGPVVVDLTAGKDSRAVLAVALRCLSADELRVRTVGPPTAPEVLAAADIAARMGVPHECGITLHRRHGSFGDGARRYVQVTEGLHTAWKIVRPHDDPAEVRASGTNGELVRTVALEDGWLKGPGRAGGVSVDRLVSYVERRQRRRASALLRPEVVDRLVARVGTQVREVVDDGVPLDDALHAVVADHHGFFLAGLRVDLEPDHRVRPLADLAVVRAGHVAGTALRRAEHVHLGLIRRASPLLAALPLAPDAWLDPGPLPEVPTPRDVIASGGAVDEARPAGPVAGAPSVPSPLPPGAVPGFSTLGVAASEPDEERRAFVTEALSDPESGIWEVADRSTVLDALDRFDALSIPVRKEIYALATGATWLAGG